MWQKFVVLALLLGWVDKGLSAATLTFAAAEFVPFVSVKDGQPSGAVTDIVRQACREAQIECSFKVQAWKDSKAEVEAGKLDGLFVVSWERDRAQWLSFSLPLLHTEWGYLVRASDTRAYIGLNSLRGYRVGVFGPSSSSEALERVKPVLGLDVQLSQDDLANVRRMLVGELDAVYMNRDVAQSLLLRNGLQGQVRYVMGDNGRNYHLAFSKQADVQLTGPFNRALRRMFKAQEVQQALTSQQLEPARWTSTYQAK
ncbi:ABC transporter substrate-binding protein [Pseudomonas sp. GV071]|jgi:polar amino acid transport system substrate-binding protein|uniref:substrate-binding periplasmic protein n=1 Tax=Pseudomonas sp. GV071 TaxID=2135754 RepID=UPI000D35F0EF|nr:transporter substrate-binding domain-containing protein [Pseudomonas sp. GV071]PTQ73112.1 amino acid ABC transporter substrate-binding protein (PAAT family) [Pseudomonas sp. GV071]